MEQGFSSFIYLYIVLAHLTCHTPTFFSGIEPGYSPQFAQFFCCSRSRFSVFAGGQITARRSARPTVMYIFCTLHTHWTSGFFVFHRWWSVQAHITLSRPSVDGSCFTTSDTSTGTSEHGYRRARDIARHLYRLSPESGRTDQPIRPVEQNTLS